MIKYLLFSALLIMILSCENSSIEKVKTFGTEEFVSGKWKTSNIKIKFLPQQIVIDTKKNILDLSGQILLKIEKEKKN